jgi:putative ABC transport system permease protein
MNLWLGILVGLKEIAAHKFRSALTMLGIILGVCSLVGMFALVAGMTKGMHDALNEIGGLEKISIIDQEPPKEQEDISDTSPGRTMTDVNAIRANCPLVECISAESELRGAKVLRGALAAKPRQIVGATQEFLEVNNHSVEFGRFITDLDLQKFNRVCVIGTKIRDQLFPSNEGEAPVVPLGERVDINGQSFTIVGVLRYYENELARKRREAGKPDPVAERAKQRRTSWGGGRSANWFDWKNDVVVIPLTTMRAVFLSGAVSNAAPDLRLTYINLRIADVNRLSDAIQQVKNVLAVTHRGIEDFGFNTQENWADRINEQARNAVRTGGLIASISLIVGGIGIMNIMLASVSERIREIGIRKAIGARQRDIFLQILAESIVLALMGGLIGLAFAFGLVKLLGALAPFDFTPVVQPEALLISFLFSATIGALAGLYPAFKASRYDPIEALRYE